MKVRYIANLIKALMRIKKSGSRDVIMWYTVESLRLIHFQ
jgi:hypothetical protein